MPISSERSLRGKLLNNSALRFLIPAGPTRETWGPPTLWPTADVLPGRLARDRTPKAVAMSSGSLGNGCDRPGAFNWPANRAKFASAPVPWRSPMRWGYWSAPRRSRWVSRLTGWRGARRSSASVARRSRGCGRCRTSFGSRASRLPFSWIPVCLRHIATWGGGRARFPLFLFRPVFYQQSWYATEF